MSSDFSTLSPDVEGSNAEGQRVSEAAGTGKQPWSKPTMWIGAVDQLTEAGPQAEPYSENAHYYIFTM